MFQIQESRISWDIKIKYFLDYIEIATDHTSISLNFKKLLTLAKSVQCTGEVKGISLVYPDPMTSHQEMIREGLYMESEIKSHTSFSEDCNLTRQTSRTKQIAGPGKSPAMLQGCKYKVIGDLSLHCQLGLQCDHCRLVPSVTECRLSPDPSHGYLEAI